MNSGLIAGNAISLSHYVPPYVEQPQGNANELVLSYCYRHSNKGQDQCIYMCALRTIGLIVI